MMQSCRLHVGWSNAIGQLVKNQIPLRRTPSWTLINEITPRYLSYLFVNAISKRARPLGDLSYKESKRKALSGASILAVGGGIRWIIASRTAATPSPVFAEIDRISEGSMPNVACICAAIRSGWAAGRSIY